MNVQTYFSMHVTIAAGKTAKIPAQGKFVIILSNSITTNPKIGIAGQAFYELPAGVGVPYPDGFTEVCLENPSGVNMTLFVAICTARIDDMRRAAMESLLATIDTDTSAMVTDLAAIEVLLTAIAGDQTISDAISTPAAIVALPVDPFLIDNAAAVNVGGGVVGIPVAGQPFAIGEDVTIANTVNYDGTHPVLASSGANQVDITYAYNAETFDGVDDSIVLATPRSIAANALRKELELHNHDGAHALYFGDANVDPDVNRGIPIMAGNGEILTNRAQIYFAAVTAAGKTGVTFSSAEHTKT